MKAFLICLLATSALAARQQKSLLGTFPFNQGDRGTPADHAHAHDHGHDAHAHAHVDADPRASRQGAPTSDVALGIGEIAAAGERCIDKVVMVEETEYDDHIECHHSYSKRCHTTYTTDFEPQQEEECEENFIKNCFIEYRKVADTQSVKFCHTPLIFEGTGPEECKTYYESQCETRYHEHEVDDDVVECKTVQDEKCEDVTQGYSTETKCTKWPRQECTNQKQKVKKYTPETDCKKVPIELCGPGGPEPTPGPEECFDRPETVVQEVPEETCNLEPQRICKQVTKLVPSLKPAEECVDVPKEVCSRSRKNPRTVQKPVVKKWCYVPSAESGLA